MSADYPLIKDLLTKLQKYFLDIEREITSIITNSKNVTGDSNKNNLKNEIIESNRRLFGALMQSIRNENLIPTSTEATKIGESEESLQAQLLRAKQQIQFLKAQQELKINQETPAIITSDRSDLTMKLKEKDRLITELQVKLQRAIQEGESRAQNLSTKHANQYAEKEKVLQTRLEDLEKQNTEIERLMQTNKQLNDDLARSRENEQKYLAINSHLQGRIDELIDKEQRLDTITREFDKSVDELIITQKKLEELEKKYEILSQSTHTKNNDREVKIKS